MTTSIRPGTLVLFATSLLAAVLGSVHAFSVFLLPLEQQFAASRTAVGFTYSLALMVLTLAVLTGPPLFSRWRPAMFMGGVCLLGAVGAVLAGLATGLPGLWLGYGVVFGAANGLGYGFGLQYAAQANPARPGFAMGVVTAAYALGAVTAPVLFEGALARGGVPVALFGLAAALLLVGPICAICVARAGTGFAAAPASHRAGPVAGFRWLWLGYGTGAATGLMAIGHAAGIAQVARAGDVTWLAPTLIALCNLAGSLIGGRLADRMSHRTLLITLPLITVGALLALSLVLPPLVYPCLGLIGFSYGGVISVYPAMIAARVGPDRSAQVYGRVFTAWGVAGLCAPGLAGWVYDQTGTYGAALLIAAAFGVISAVSVQRLPLKG